MGWNTTPTHAPNSQQDDAQGNDISDGFFNADWTAPDGTPQKKQDALRPVTGDDFYDEGQPGYKYVLWVELYKKEDYAYATMATTILRAIIHLDMNIMYNAQSEPFWEQTYKVVGIYRDDMFETGLRTDALLIPTKSVQAISRDMSQLLLAGGVLAALAILALLLYFFVAKEKKRTAIERSMSKCQCRVSLLAGLMILTIIAASLGSLCGGLVLDKMVEFTAFQRETAEELGSQYMFDTHYSPWAADRLLAEDTVIEVDMPIAV